MLGLFKSRKGKIAERPSAWTVSRDYRGPRPAFPQSTALHRASRFVVSSAVLDVTQAHLRLNGARGTEGALCWAGTLLPEAALITSALLFTDADRHGGVHVTPAQTGLLYAHCHS